MAITLQGDLHTRRKKSDRCWYSPLLGERGEAQGGTPALLAVSDRVPVGDELIWTGATAPFATNTRKELHSHILQLVESGFHVAELKLHMWNQNLHNTTRMRSLYACTKVENGRHTHIYIPG